MDGKILNKRYEVLCEIGKGGMGVVYKAKCNLLNRIVAVKVLDNSFGDDKEFIKRFKSEAQSAASLSHQNIVSVYDVGYEGDIQFIVMEYVDGKTLKEYMVKKGLHDWKEIVKISIQICQGIEHAHRNKIIHRDIKPHNILITNNGDVKVTDFGIAKAVATNTLTIDGNTIGSVHYFSPEQAKGEFVDIKSDFYSLGITMYEMVTGVLPFEGDSQIAVALQHINQKPRPPIEKNPNIPKKLNNIILKAIKKDKNSRFQKASDILEALNGLLTQPEEVKFKDQFNKRIHKIRKYLGNNIYLLKNKLNNYFTKKRKDIEETNEKQIFGNFNIRKLLKTKLNSYFKKERKENKETNEKQLFSSFSNFNIKEFINTNYTKKEYSSKAGYNIKKQQVYKFFREKRNQLIVGGIFALLIITIIITNIIKPIDDSTNNEYDVGQYIGKDYKEIVEILKDSGWSTKYINLEKTNPDVKVKKNIIIKQYPLKGSKVTINVDKINLYYSSGEAKNKLLKIPDIIGDNYKKSDKELREMGFKIIKVHGVKSNNDKESVIEVIPKSGELVNINEEINIFYSLGENNNYIEIPDLVGLSNSKAQDKLEDFELTIGIIKPKNSNEDAIVISQNPKSGFLAKKGQSVDLFFSEEESTEPTTKPTKKPTAKSTYSTTYDNGNISLSKSWFTNRSAPYYVHVKYVSTDNSSKNSEASWTYNLIEQIPDSVPVNNTTSGETYRRVITVNGSTVDDRIVKVL
ncbi:MAG: Stk1 family PASTA domain-containing Ser/Thr kinase [Clostridiales bacterium]